MERQSFLFRKEWCDAARELPPEIRLEIYDAIIEYGVYEKFPERLKKMASIAFGMAKAVIDRDNEELAKKEAQSKRNSDNASKRKPKKATANATAKKEW